MKITINMAVASTEKLKEVLEKVAPLEEKNDVEVNAQLLSSHLNVFSGNIEHKELPN